jgi:uncharacterized protein YprB with RNaseH-like and TPR domain
MDQISITFDNMYIEHLLSYLPGIGKKTEKNLREHGIKSWADLLTNNHIPYLNSAKHQQIKAIIQEFHAKLKTEPVKFIESTFKQKDKFVIFGDFKDSVAYFDIETTGLTPGLDHTTTIAIWNGSELKTFVRDENLHEFQAEINKYKLLVTFYGSCFDIPFLKQDLGIDFSNHFHIDLCFVLRSLGYSGGLKKIEKEFLINRGDLVDLDGSLAVSLWYKYQKSKNRKYLETLLAYNAEDVVNLEVLMYKAWNLGKTQYDLNLPELPEKQRTFTNPFTAHRDVLRELGLSR